MVSQKPPTSISVGVVLDLESLVGRTSEPSISLALEDFYISHPDYNTRLRLLFRDSKKDIIVAASEGKQAATVEFQGFASYFFYFLCLK